MWNHSIAHRSKWCPLNYRRAGNILEVTTSTCTSSNGIVNSVWLTYQRAFRLFPIDLVMPLWMNQVPASVANVVKNRFITSRPHNKLWMRQTLDWIALLVDWTKMSSDWETPSWWPSPISILNAVQKFWWVNRHNLKRDTGSIASDTLNIQLLDSLFETLKDLQLKTDKSSAVTKRRNEENWHWVGDTNEQVKSNLHVFPSVKESLRS